MYQACTEFGWFLTSGSANQPFGSSFPITLYTDLCRDIFGPQFTDDKIQGYINATNEKIGGINQNMTNIYMTQGALDPWNTLGAGEAQGVTIIPDECHCSDVAPFRVLDEPGVNKAKKQLEVMIDKWLAKKKKNLEF